MLTAMWTKVIVAIGALCVIVLGVIGYRHLFRPELPSKLPPAIVRRVDSVNATRAASDSARRETRITNNTAITSTNNAESYARSTQRRDSARRAQIDSSVGSAQASHVLDSASASLWHSAFLAERARADTLRLGLDSALVRVDSLTRVAQRSSAQIARDSARLAAVEKLNNDLVRAANNINDCRVAYIIPCPSRKVAFASGVLATLAVVEAHRLGKIP